MALGGIKGTTGAIYVLVTIFFSKQVLQKYNVRQRYDVNVNIATIYLTNKCVYIYVWNLIMKVLEYCAITS